MSRQAASAARLKRVLAALSRNARQEIDREIEAQAIRIVAAMKARAPVGTGQLRNSVRYTKRSLRVSILAGGEPTRKASTGGVVRSFVQGVRDGLRGRSTRRAAKGTAYDYAFANEFGTQNMRAQPFFYPTWRRNRNMAQRAIRAAVKKAVQNVR
jgi:HK97 gp10 family phage protein